MIHYPLEPIQDIYKTKMVTFKGSLENCAKVIKDGLVGHTLIDLRPSDYAFIAEQWETALINAYQNLQNQQFREMYGEEY